MTSLRFLIKDQAFSFIFNHIFHLVKLLENTVRNNLHGLHGSCSLVVRFVSQVVVCYIDYGVFYIEAFKLEEEIRLPETFIILHHLWSYVLDLMLCPHHSCIGVQTQAFGPSYINHVVSRCDLVVNSMKYVVAYITRPICFPVAKYMFYVVKHKFGDNLHKSCSLVVRYVSQVVLYYKTHQTF